MIFPLYEWMPPPSKGIFDQLLEAHQDFDMINEY